MKQKICDVTKIGGHGEEWLNYRRTGIGGSDAATVMGLNPYTSPYVLYNDKIGAVEDHKESTEAMRLGTDLEEYVAQRWQEATGKKVRRNNFMWRSEEHPFMIADVDRDVVGENAGLECKTTSPFTKYDIENGDIPPYYYCQCQHYMQVMGYDRMYLAVLVFSKGFYHFVIEKNEEDAAALIEAEADFWARVQNGIPPEIDGSDSTMDFIKKHNLQSNAGMEAIATRESQNLCRNLREVQESIKTLTERENEIKAGLMAYMGACEKYADDICKISYKTQTSRRPNTTKLKTSYKNVYEAVLEESTSRPLKITFKKVKE